MAALGARCAGNEANRYYDDDVVAVAAASVGPPAALLNTRATRLLDYNTNAEKKTKSTLKSVVSRVLVPCPYTHNASTATPIPCLLVKSSHLYL